MTRIVLIGSYAAITGLMCLLVINYDVLPPDYVSFRIGVGVGILVYLTIVALFLYKDRGRTAAWLIICLYGAIGLVTLHSWGINTSIGILALSFVIILTGVVLGAKYIFAVTTCIIISMIFIQHLTIIGLSQPDRSMMNSASTYSDVISYAIIFSIFTLVAWLSVRKTEKALIRATRAERALAKERDALSFRVKEQTKSLIDAQENELKQLYAFAELGQLTTIILHELANYLNILTLDIDDLKDRHDGSLAVTRAKESIFYIDSIIEQVRHQITHTDDAQQFDIRHVLHDTIDQAKKKLNNPKIKLYIKGRPSHDFTAYGDPLRLAQTITILITNAVQASKHRQPDVIVTVRPSVSRLRIAVKDYGNGITDAARQTLFQPKKGRNGAGLGIGLYITKQIIETHFKGSIWLSPETEFTQFNIEIPIPTSTRRAQNAPTAPSPHTRVALDPVP